MRITWVVPVLALVCWTEHAAASDEVRSYAPFMCSDDAEGMVYVTLSGQVFRFPYDQPLYFGTLPPERQDRVPPPEKPAETEGCPGNPMVASYVMLGSRLEVTADGVDFNSYGRLQGLKLVGVTPHYAGLQISVERRFEKVCLMPGVQKTLGNGMEMCSVRPNDPDLVKGWASYYRSPLELYQKPFGRPLVVECDPSILSEITQCSVQYKLLDVVNIVYEFSPSSLPLKSVIKFDKALRDALIEAHVEEKSTFYAGSDERPSRDSALFFPY